MSLPINDYKVELECTCIFFIWTLLTNFLVSFISDSFPSMSPGKSWLSSFLAGRSQSVLVVPQRYLSLLPPRQNWKKFPS